MFESHTRAPGCTSASVADRACRVEARMRRLDSTGPDSALGCAGSVCVTSLAKMLWTEVHDPSSRQVSRRLIFYERSGI